MSRHLVCSALVSLVATLTSACGGSSAELGPEYTAEEGRARVAGDDAPEAEVEIPTGRLPEGVEPLHYSLYLEVVPERPRFSGRVEIRVQLSEATELIWMHGARMNVTDAEVLPEGQEAVSAELTQVDEEGVAALRTASPVGPGEVTISITYDAPFDTQLKGLYRVETGGDAYAFTQFEATSARYAFPCFDEPRFKTPFDVTLAVRREHVAIANTSAIDERAIGELKEITYRTTERLPTYLVAMAVGPLDVVEHAPIPANAVRDRPLPFRGVAARGQGSRLAYALANTGALLAELEGYFGTPYPYDKLDIIAVPDFAAGAMENAGAITFREVLLLLDPDDAPEDQRRAFAYVMAHELAHQWFGNLVTMPWWDDIWLNEAFATWMGNKAVRGVHPEYQADVGMVASIRSAMRADSLTSARQIRQPIEENHDIRNAFDAITYRKGGGVLEMFERYLGEETFREGIREYLNRHRFGTATADDLLDALSQMAGQDVGTPFRTFLFQPGVPTVEVRRVCDDEGARLELAQSRYFPVGSSGDREAEWQIPFCARYRVGREVHSRCELVTERQSQFAMPEGCPSWVMPNADAAGYYRFSMPAEDLARVTGDGFRELSARERLALADDLVAGFEAATVTPDAMFDAMTRLAADEHRLTAEAPLSVLNWTRDHALGTDAERAAFARFVERLYTPAFRRLGWAPARGRREDGERALLRRSVIGALVELARVPALRREAARRGRAYVGYGGDGRLHPDAVHRDLVSVVLPAAVEESDAEFFDHLRELALESEDALFRSRALRALAAAREPALADRALALALEPRARVNEVTLTLDAQLAEAETRPRAWAWFQANFDEAYARVATTRAGYAPWSVSGFCSESDAAEVEAFFEPRIASLPGGPRNLRGALEAIRLCAARAEAQGEATRARFGPRSR